MEPVNKMFARLVPALIPVACLAAAPYDDLRADLRRLFAESSAASVAVALAVDGKIVWEEGLGWADRERRIPANEHTLYSLASISKPITATGLMLLVERGLIDLDKPANEYLGQAKVRARVGDAAQASVRRIANHSSGLPLHYQFFYADEPFKRPSMDETIMRYASLVTPPGERYQYSNLGFGILDYIVERTSGKRFADYMREQVFVPLGLTHTSVDIGPGLEPYAAARYAPDGSPIPFYTFDHPGGSAIWSSAHDLVRFGMFHLKSGLADQRRILRNQSIDEMHKPTMKTGPKAHYGIGWAIQESDIGMIVSHTGSMGGVATSLRLVPSRKIAVAVLCNAGVPLPHRVADRVFERLIPGWTAASVLVQPPTAFRPPDAIRGKWAGELVTYAKSIPLRMDVQDDGDIHVRLGSQLETLLNSPGWNDGTLTGQFAGDIGAEDANRRPYTLQLTLKLREGVMNGPASALSVPSNRAGNALTQWVELRRAQR